MPITTVSSRDFNQDVSRAKKAAQAGPVFITDRGRAAHVLLTIEEYQRITGKGVSVIDLLSMDAEPDIVFEPGKVEIVVRPADLS
ncbi:MAG: hypothetical protein RLZZ501_139 [Pseudomonadota bacterium]|jgi:antitoxin (DNA-binding transcriptional repressor) of toxin-antitoxin stability system